MLDFHALLIIMVVIWTAGKIFRTLHLPVVFGELLGGIVVGPSVLNFVQPSEVITVIAELGIFFLMLHAGLETNFNALMVASKRSFFLEFGSFVASFLACFLVCIFLQVPILGALFISNCIAITSFTFIARFLKESKLTKLPIATTLTAAAILSEIFGLIILSLLLKFNDSGTMEFMPVFVFTAKIIAFFILVLLGGFTLSPWLHRFIYFGNKGFTLTLIFALLVGLAAEKVGLHMIIGAFLVGLFLSANTIENRTYSKIEDRVYALSYSFFGPVFFVSIAFSLELNVMVLFFPLVALLTIIAFAVRWFSTTILGVLFGFTFTESGFAGLLFNARGGGVGMIVAAIGLEAGILSKELFSVVLLVIFITTFIAIPLAMVNAKEMKITYKR